MIKTIREIQREVHQNSIEHGWWKNPPSFPELISLVHSECSEALEEYRNLGMVADTRIEDGKPEGIPAELADVVIRVMDICEWYEIDLEAEIERKHAYNMTRPYRHGGKAL